MKGLLFGAISALLLTTSAATIAAPAKYENLDTQRQSQLAYKVSVPHITSAGVRNHNHFIKVEVLGMSLQDLMISLPSQMERFEKVQVKDQSGREISTKTKVSKERVTITFDQPITDGNSVEVEFLGVRSNIPKGRILLYGVSGQRQGIQGDIPIGTARIDLPDQS
jgi:hypothetical protein